VDESYRGGEVTQAACDDESGPVYRILGSPEVTNGSPRQLGVTPWRQEIILGLLLLKTVHEHPLRLRLRGHRRGAKPLSSVERTQPTDWTRNARHDPRCGTDGNQVISRSELAKLTAAGSREHSWGDEFVKC
jgi:hypothetical protein